MTNSFSFMVQTGAPRRRSRIPLWRAPRATRTIPRGPLTTFQWVFPVERYTKGGIGIQPNVGATHDRAITSFAHLPEEEIAARLPCELRDHPLLLIPIEHRKPLLEKLIGKEKA